MFEDRKIPHPIKAYNNSDFLHSPHARTIRLLAEYLEPQARLRRQKIRTTIVFFGSARALSPEDLKQYLDDAEVRLSDASPAERRELEREMKMQGKLTRYYEDAAKLAGLLTKHFQRLPDPRDRHVVCSGGGPGIMEAANRGAAEAGGKTVGFGISLPFEQAMNRYLSYHNSFEFHYFFMRKYWFVYLAKALVAFPGGFGTLDELFEVLTLRQTRKVTKKLPIVLYGSDYWKQIINWDALTDWGVISPDDVHLFRPCDTPEEALDYLSSEVSSAVPAEPDPQSLE